MPPPKHVCSCTPKTAQSFPELLKPPYSDGERFYQVYEELVSFNQDRFNLLRG